MEFISAICKRISLTCVNCQEADAVSNPSRSKSKKYIVLGISGAIFVGSFALTGPFVAPALRKVCLPYIPATNGQVDNLLTVLKGRHGNLLDIGSGDGRIVISAAKQGLRSYGVELNYWLVMYSRYRAWRQRQHKMATFFRKDLWKGKLLTNSGDPDETAHYEPAHLDLQFANIVSIEVGGGERVNITFQTDLSAYDNIIIFGVNEMMPKLEKKFSQEISDNCQIISCRSPLSKWEPIFSLGTGLEIVWVYRHPKSADSWPRTMEDLQKLYQFTDDEMRTIELGRSAENTVYKKQSAEDEEDDYDLPSGL